MHVDAGGRLNTHQGTQELRMPKNEMRGYVAIGNQFLRAVDVLKNRIRKKRALCDSRLDDFPIRSADHEWHDVELPWPRMTARIVIYIISDAVFADHIPRRSDASRKGVRRHALERARDCLPMRANRAVPLVNLIVAWRQLRWQRADGLGCLRVGFGHVGLCYVLLMIAS